MTKHRKQNPFKKQTLRMADRHMWDAPPGYKIVVADRGAVSFNIPRGWHLEKMEPLELYDKKPPNDDTRLSMSYWKFDPRIDWTGLPLGPLLEQATQGLDRDDRELERGDIIPVERDDLELVWTWNRYIDKVEPREAITRTAVARGFTVTCLITCDFWVDHLKRIEPVWNEVLRSLQLGRVIADPTKGPALH